MGRSIVDRRAVWVAYSTKPPYLPVAVADTAEQLAALLGVHRTTVAACWRRYCKGQARRTCYHRVPLPQENTGYTKENHNNG